MLGLLADEDVEAADACRGNWSPRLGVWPLLLLLPLPLPMPLPPLLPLPRPFPSLFAFAFAADAFALARGTKTRVFVLAIFKAVRVSYVHVYTVLISARS
jgi:hypothetical protein